MNSQTKTPLSIGLLLLLLLGSFYSPLAQSHAGRENYVWVNVETNHISGRFEVNRLDLKKKLGVDLEVDDALLLDEVKRTAPEVQAYLLDNFTLSFNGEQQDIEFLEPSVFQDTGRFVQYHYRVEGVPEDDMVHIRDTIFLEEAYLKNDPLHRSVIVLEHNKYRGLEFGHESSALVFGPHLQESDLSVVNPPQLLIWKDFFYQGLLHVWIGFDHMLFLLTLLLTAVLVREGGQWQSVHRAKDAFINILKIVTVFTLSHSITLALAVLGIVNVPIGPVEATIAASIIVVALNNIFFFFRHHRWLLIFIFGLIHGLGFASALGDLQFRNVKIEEILIMFNLGVEFGQIAVVLLVLPVLFYFRNSIGYRTRAMPIVSWAAVIMASYWLGTRLDWWSHV